MPAERGENEVRVYMKFLDRASISGIRRTADGYGVADVRCARSGVQQYSGIELGIIGLPVVNVYRPEHEVFSKDSLGSFAHKPVTDDHPPELVNADNWKQYSLGDIGDEVARDGEFVRVPVKLMDSSLINKIESGKSEISMGYTADIEFTDGVAPCGTPYQAIQKNIRINHLAVVDKGRAGEKCRFGDSAWAWGNKPLNDNKDGVKKLKTILVDGFTVETTEAGATAIEKLINDKKALQDLADEAEAAKAKAIADSEAKLAAKDAEIEKLQKEQLTDEQVNELVNKRSELIEKAKKVAADQDYSGLSNEAIKVAAVKAVLGEEVIEGKAKEYIEARFDILVEEAEDQKDQEKDTFADAMTFADSGKSKANDKGYQSYLARLQNGWKEVQ